MLENEPRNSRPSGARAERTYKHSGSNSEVVAAPKGKELRIARAFPSDRRSPIQGRRKRATRGLDSTWSCRSPQAVISLLEVQLGSPAFQSDLGRLMEQQRALEERLRQEEQDRKLALRLQKEMRKVSFGGKFLPSFL